MRGFPTDALRSATWHPGFEFTQGMGLMKLPAWSGVSKDDANPTLLYDLQADPRQQQPINDAAIEARLCGAMRELMEECEAPAEQYERMGL